MIHKNDVREADDYTAADLILDANGREVELTTGEARGLGERLIEMADEVEQ